MLLSGSHSFCEFDDRMTAGPLVHGKDAALAQIDQPAAGSACGLSLRPPKVSRGRPSPPQMRCQRAWLAGVARIRLFGRPGFSHVPCTRFPRPVMRRRQVRLFRFVAFLERAVVAEFPCARRVQPGHRRVFANKISQYQKLQGARTVTRRRQKTRARHCQVSRPRSHIRNRQRCAWLRPSAGGCGQDYQVAAIPCSSPSKTMCSPANTLLTNELPVLRRR